MMEYNDKLLLGCLILMLIFGVSLLFGIIGILVGWTVWGVGTLMLMKKKKRGNYEPI